MRNVRLSFMMLLVIMMIASISVFAGGAKEGSGQEESANGADEVMTLQMFYPVQVGGPLTKLVEKIADDFHKVNPNIIVEPIYTGNYDDTVVKIQTAIQGKLHLIYF